MLRDSNISLDCSTDANPDAHVYHFYLNDSLIGNSNSGVFNTTVMTDGVYTCVPVNTVGTGENATVSITVVGELHWSSFNFSVHDLNNYTRNVVLTMPHGRVDTNFPLKRLSVN